ncbi:sulfate adenylyltransferase subunit CysN, partial [Francisella tularensis subsp. holarctica]|nr:sulfate adenylyltransferase subunit CysN [Francisella tularensis subsp. holarctica]
IRFVPISALDGDNVVSNSPKIPWFRGSPLMNYLETIKIDYAYTDEFRFPVKLVCRPNSELRVFQGTVVSGSSKIGDTI